MVLIRTIKIIIVKSYLVMDMLGVYSIQHLYQVVRCRLERDDVVVVAGVVVVVDFFFLHDNGFGPLAFFACKYR